MRICITAKKKPTFTAHLSWNGLHYYCPNCTNRTLGFTAKCERCKVKLKNPTEPYTILTLDRPDLYSSAELELAKKENYNKLKLV